MIPARGTSALLAVVVVLGLTSCTADASPEPSGSQNEVDEHFGGFERCADLPSPWLCATIQVPLDRNDEGAGTIPVRILGIPHSDTSTAEGLPLFATPGGAGDAGIENYALWQLPGLIRAHHDVVAVDPRGTGMSAAIDCSALQAGSASVEQLVHATEECGRQLGTASDQYGGSHRAMDIDAAREFMGFDEIILHGTSYGGVDVQAYASRFSDRLAAAVIDGGFVVDDIDMFFGTDVAAGTIGVVATACDADAGCAASTDDPVGVVSTVVRTLAEGPATQDGVVVITEASIASLIRESGKAVEVVAASLVFLAGDTVPMAALVSDNDALTIPPAGAVETYSAGANAAAWCNDQVVGFDVAASDAERKQQLDQAVAELDDDAFAPWSKDGWRQFWRFDQCVGWPTPSRHEPVLDGGASFAGTPALLLVGDQDPALASAPKLANRFPDGTTVVVPGAGHPSLSLGGCVAAYEAQFIETLEIPRAAPCSDG